MAGCQFPAPWLLTHYLIVGSPARQGQLARFIGEARRGQPVGATLRIVDDLAARATSQAIRDAAADFAARLRADKVRPSPTPAR